MNIIIPNKPFDQMDLQEKIGEKKENSSQI
jgi:hypothetical protein